MRCLSQVGIPFECVDGTRFCTCFERKSTPPREAVAGEAEGEEAAQRAEYTELRMRLAHDAELAQQREQRRAAGLGGVVHEQRRRPRRRQRSGAAAARRAR